MVVLVLAISSGGLMVQTALLGGQIRHTEVRNGLAVQNLNEIDGVDNSNAIQQKEKDDD